jgi:hypothetical protein
MTIIQVKKMFQCLQSNAGRKDGYFMETVSTTLDLTSNSRVTNRLTQILEEIKRLQESLEYNRDKFSDLVQRALIEGNIIEVTGHGTCNGMTWRNIKKARVYENLFFENGRMFFRDDLKNRYCIEIENVELVTVRTDEERMS